MTLLRELIDIPEQVHKGDFVLKLTEGVRDPQGTLKHYVITDQIRDAFDHALGLIKAALDGKQSKAAFLHGSFGSGKSHFMAVLHLLLSQDPKTRALPELAPLLAKHRWLEGRRFLLVPFHMIGAKGLEQAIFGQYIDYVGRLHPDSNRPPLFLGHVVLEQADLLRKQLGDEKFFGQLGSSDSDWGSLEAWTADRYDQARSAPPDDPERYALISSLVTHLLPAYHRVVGADGGENYVGLDEGLSILSHHAKSLGYDALVLFLDEVILWLASMVADLKFVNNEGAKLAKLVEGQGPPRELPIVSFLARQRDLRELVGEHVPGAEKLGFLDVFKWWGGRFDMVKLEDRNLPVIVERRLLKPRGTTEKQELDSAFSTTRRMRQEIFDTLLTHGFGEDDFRRVYPFSPALVQTLVAVSSVLQRERTAIKVLMQLLVGQRETLEVGQLVPVGDLFDVIAEGDEPFSEGMRQHFENAKKLYHQKLRPRLLADYGLNDDQLRALPEGDLQRKGFCNDDRLVKTLLLAALVSEVEALKDMTAGRLVALNHGTIKAPIPGQETGLVLNKLKHWAADVGELRLQGDPANPTISLQIVGVDTGSIVARARQSADNVGNRKATIKRILFEEMGIRAEDNLWVTHEFVWLGTRRHVQVVYGNVRELPDESLRAPEDGWRLVIDYPFDDGHTPDDDIKRIEEFRQRGNSRTVCWIPAFLSREREVDLGTLVALDYALLNDQRFQDCASHLPPVERTQARSLLTSQQSQLRVRIVQALEIAYGISSGDQRPGMVVEGLEVSERFQCLDGAQRLMTRPGGSNLRQAMEKLCHQMLELQFPKHPSFEVEIKGAVVKRVFEWVQRAARDTMHRVVVDRDRRREVRGVADPLDLGSTHEDALVLGTFWPNHFERQAAQAKGEPLTVGRMRAWTDLPQPRGLPLEIQDLLILTHAEVRNRRFFLHGGPVTVSLDRRLEDEYELREQPLPSEEIWTEARERAAKMFGAEIAQLLGAANVGHLIESVRQTAKQGIDAARQLADDLSKRMSALAVEPSEAPRWKTADAALRLLETMDGAQDDLFVERLATAKAPCPWETMGTSFKQAAGVSHALQQTRWSTLETAWGLTGAHEADAQTLRQGVEQALCSDELTLPLAAALQKAEAEANAMIRRAVVEPPPLRPDPERTPEPGWAEIDAGSRDALMADQFWTLCEELREKLAKDDRRIHVNWRIEEKRSS